MVKKRLLFISEDVTLAQVVRLVQLAKCIDPHLYEIHFACSQFPDLIFKDLFFVKHFLPNIGSAELLLKTSQGKWPYSENIINSYIKEDIALINRIMPDLILGDFRLSLSVSADYCKIPLTVLINAYWSPHYELSKYPLPDHRIINILGESLASLFYPLARPFVFKLYASSINKCRKRYGLKPIGSLEQILSYGDYVLYPDPEELVQVKNLPASHHYLGAVLWSPSKAVPYADITKNLPLIYVTLGSSGDISKLSEIINGMAGLPVRVVVSTAGRIRPENIPDNVSFYDFLSGEDTVKSASLVICNGGSTTAYQALNEGVPVIGIPSNLDQYLSMGMIEKSGAGILLKSRKLRSQDVSIAVQKILKDPGYKDSVAKVKVLFNKMDYRIIFPEFIRKVLQP